MTRSTLGRAALLLLAGAGLAAAPPVAAQEALLILAIFTATEWQVQRMAFVLLNAMRAQGVTVEVMLCGPAADTARLTAAPCPLRAGSNSVRRPDPAADRAQRGRDAGSGHHVIAVPKSRNVIPAG